MPDDAAEALDFGVDPLQVVLQHAGGVLRVALLAVAGGFDGFGEQHRDQLPLGRGRHRRRGRRRSRRLHRGRWGGDGLGGFSPVGVCHGTDRAEQLQGGVLGEDRLLQPLQPDARLDAQLVDQGAARAPVGAQGVGLAARAVQGEHQLAVQVLAQGVAADEALQLADHLAVAPERQVRLDAGLERGQAQLVDPDQLRPGVGLLVAGGADVGQRRAAPQPQGLAQEPGGPLRVGLGERLPPLHSQPLELVQVELVGTDLDHVTGVLCN